MKRLTSLLLLAALAGCATYRAEFTGKDVSISATTSPISAEAKGKALEGTLYRNDEKVAHAGPLDGSIRWEKGKGFTVTKDATAGNP